MLTEQSADQDPASLGAHMHMTIFGSNDDLSFFYGSCCFCRLCDFVYHFIGYMRLSWSFYLKKDEFHKHRCHLSVRERERG